MGSRGEAIASVDGRELGVRYAAPGDRAAVRIEAADGRLLRGRLVKIERTSPDAVPPRCPHFGVCGGCQWQHLGYVAQLGQKRELVRQALRRGGLSEIDVLPAIGCDPPWQFRTQMHVFIGARAGDPILGFQAWGEQRLVNVRQCAVSHPALVRTLEDLRAVWRGPLDERLRTAAVVSALRIRVAETTGDLVVGLVTRHPLSAATRDRFVRAIQGRVSGLTGLVELASDRAGAPGGLSATPLWGRPYLRVDVAGVRFHLPLLADCPLNMRAFPGVLELILNWLGGGPEDALVELSAGIGAFSLHFGLHVGRVIAVTSGRDLEVARENAVLGGFSNVTFLPDGFGREWREAVGVERVTLAFLHPPGTGLTARALQAARRAGVRRVVYLGRAFGTVSDDLALLVREGFAVEPVQPVDLSPHTSRVHVLAACALR